MTATGNITGRYFLGNGSLLSGIVRNISGVANIDIRGNVTASGNVSARFFLGNGSLLTGIVAATLPETANVDIRGNVTATGNVSAEYFIGNGYYMTLNGLLLIPQGNVANEAARLALNVPAGTVVTQDDNGLQYLLTIPPASSNSNWLHFTGINFSVPTVFGRTGAIIASPNDYLDSFIQLSANIGTATTSDHVSDALAYLNNNKVNLIDGNVYADIVDGNVIGAALVSAENVYSDYILSSSASIGTTLFNPTGDVSVRGDLEVPFGNISFNGSIYGNGSQLTGVTSALAGTANIDIRGNVSATGNVSAEYFLGNGALLSGIEQYVLPSTANIDIRGNVIGAALVSAENVYSDYILSSSASIGTTLFNPTGDVSVRGDLEVPFGNISFNGSIYGNGSQLTGVTSALTGTANIDIRGNVSATGNVSASLFVGNVQASNVITNGLSIIGNIGGHVNITGNVVAPYFVGNGALLTGLNLTTSTGGVAIGNGAGAGAGEGSVSMGTGAGSNTGAFAVAIGTGSGVGQRDETVAIGAASGSLYQGAGSVAMGASAAQYNQGANAVAIGYAAGADSQGTTSVAVGYQAALTQQGARTVAIGGDAGATYQGVNSVAIGYKAGQTYLGTNNVCIGAYAGNNTTQTNCIILNASGQALNATRSGCWISPVASSPSAGVALYYNATTSEMYYSTSSQRLKSNIETMTKNSSVIYDLRPVEFNTADSEDRQVGLIAEEVDSIDPALSIRKSGGEVIGISWNVITTYLLAEIKALRERVNILESR